LLVEDDAATRLALQRILARQGWEVVATHAMTDAIPRLAEGFDAAILDLMLPDGDGTELLRAVRRSSMPTRVVVTTGTDDPERLRAVRALSPDALLFKPVDLADIDAALNGRD
jgi:two-component system chemotaxis response regulator CheY